MKQAQINTGEKKLYAFTIKKGDLTRNDWDQTNQSLVSSISDIIFNYFPSRVPPEFKNLEKVICICFGGLALLICLL